MSLVNDMLRDLDQRRQQGPGQQSSSQYVASAAVSPRPANIRVWLLAVAVFVLLSVAGYLLWPTLSTKLQPLLSS
ncbi:MAG: hypothetical protein V7677_20195, partial [Motiliproteus sp.]